VTLEVLPVQGIGDVRPGDDLAALITTAAPWLADGDVLVVTSKIVSKAEGRLVAVPADGPERLAAREEALLAETARTVARRGHTRIVQTHHGFVMASAGIDASNVDREHLVLLPVDPDGSARALRSALRDGYGLDVAVIVSDTMGRPWRNGLTDVALGAAGIDAMRDYRGEHDAYGNELRLTQMAVVDELAGAAELVKGKYDQVPVAVVRGLGATAAADGPAADGPAADGPGARPLVRGAEHDLFSLGTAEARAAGMRASAALSNVDEFADAPLDDAVLHAALDAVTSLDGFAGFVEMPVKAGMPVNTARVLVPHAGADADPLALARAGATVHRLRSVLASAGVRSAWLAGTRPLPVDLPPGRIALGVLALGLPARQ
jgi:coenzyme F420-0:L-glutamate ligase/coenzyme F420-1:gamma-L-glutamate ligase